MVVPAILQKLPEAFCLTIRREADFLNWSMGELLSAFLNKLEQREDHDYAISSGGNTQNRKDSNTFYIKQEVKNCAFCLRRHAPANCKKVDACKNILVKYGRFFKKGDMEPEIVSQLNYVTSVGICDKQVKPAVSEFEARPEAYPTTNSPSSFHVGEGDCPTDYQTECSHHWGGSVTEG